MKDCLLRIPVFGLLRTALWAALGMVCFAFVIALAADGHYEDGIFIPDGVCVSNCDSSGSPGGGSDYSRPSKRDKDNSERIDKANELLRAAKAAARSDDAREALRLAREAQAMADDYTWLKSWVRQLEDYIAQEGVRQRAVAARKTADAAREEANAAYDRGDWRAALVLYRRALATDADSLSDYGKQRVKDLDKLLKSETEAADRERRHRPEVERLRAEAKAMVELRPADALAKLDAALKLLPGDTETSGDWWLAKANLSLREAKYDEAIQALQNAQNFAGDSPEVARARTQVADERKRQGENVRNAFDDLRQRLAAAANADISAVDAGAQLKSVEHHSRKAQSQGKDTDKEIAREGFDTPGESRGTLAYPDKNKHQQVPPSALDKQIPGGAKDDPAIKEMQAWYRSLDARKAEKEEMIANIKEEQKTSKDPILDVKIATLTNDVKRLNDDQAKATATVKERVEVIKKQMLDKGLAWDESPSSATTQTPAPANAPTSQSSSSKLDFIRN